MAIPIGAIRGKAGLHLPHVQRENRPFRLRGLSSRDLRRPRPYVRVSVDPWVGTRLPCVENVVSLLAAEISKKSISATRKW